MIKRSTLVLTDSGGLQEEVPAFGIPVLVLRQVTERPEGVQAGTARLVGTDTQRIVAESRRLLENARAHEAIACLAELPHGPGRHALVTVAEAALCRRG